MKVKPFRIGRKEYEAFQALQIKTRNDWWAVFSVNHKEEIWPFVCYGVTPREKRHYVQLEEYKLLSDIGGYFLHNVDEGGGRFFINKSGVSFIKGERETSKSTPEQFVEWKWDDEPPQTMQELWERENEETRGEYPGLISRREAFLRKHTAIK